MRLLALLLVSMTMAGQATRDLRYERESPAMPDQRQRWALVVGVSSYKYAPPEAQLRYAHRDAEAFADFLRSAEGGSTPASHVRLLTEGAATIAGLRGALREWLPRVAGPNDVVYLFLAGHAVAGDGGATYFAAHDSDPQNLHATGLSVAELDRTLREVRASQIVLIADTCHAGGIGWTSDAASPGNVQPALEALGARDRSVLKLLASRPSERSFEGPQYGGGHGVFTHALLEGLRGVAERDRDGVVRASEVIAHLSRVVPQATGSQQNPRIAGNFDGGLPMALLSPPVLTAAEAELRLAGRAGTQVYLDGQFRGAIRPSGELVIGGLRSGAHLLSIDEPGIAPVEQELRLDAGRTILHLETAEGLALLRLQRLIGNRKILEKDGAWELYRIQPWEPREQALAASLVASALEEIAQACVIDYVQSTTNALKAPMLTAAANAYGLLKEFRKNDTALEAKSLFCRGRAQIARGELAQAVSTLEESLRLDRGFACSWNARGVALGRLGRAAEARESFQQARRLTPQWALPPLELARQHLAAGQLREALPFLEEAARLFPKSVGIQWSLLRVHRLLGNAEELIRVAQRVQSLDRNYAPLYSELGAFFESRGDAARAAQAYESYLVLAPNFADSDTVRQRMQKLRKP